MAVAGGRTARLTRAQLSSFRAHWVPVVMAAAPWVAVLVGGLWLGPSSSALDSLPALLASGVVAGLVAALGWRTRVGHGRVAAR